MKNYLGFLIGDAKEFLCNETNRVFIAVIAVGLLICLCQLRTERELKRVYNFNAKAEKKLLTEIKTNRDKIHFRYFNLTRSLEDINGVEIDTRSGEVKR